MTFGKTLFTTLVVASIVTVPVVLTQSIDKNDQIFDPTQMTDDQMIIFSSNVGKTIWTSFVRGWYSKSNETFKVDEECFGDWLVQDLHNLDNQATQILDHNLFEIPTLLSDLNSIWHSFKKIIMKTNHACGFCRFGETVANFLITECNPDDVFANIQANAFSTITKLMPLVQILNDRESIKTFNQIYTATSTIGYTLGEIGSNLVGFQ